MHLIILIATIVVGILSWIAYKIVRRYTIHEIHHSEFYGGELVADVLRAHGVKFLFTLCGGHISPILVAAEKRKIRVIDVRHEASAVFAADAVSRLSGTVGVAAVTAGPGLTNTITAIKNAQMAESPVLVIAGGVPGILRGRGSLQDIDQLALVKSICKFSTRVEFVKDIVPALCRAFYEAASGTPGPVFVELPIDTLYSYNLVKQHLEIPENPKTLRQRFVNWYMRLYLFHLFAEGFHIKPAAPGEAPTQIPVRQPLIDLPSHKHATQLAQLIAKAKRPVLLLSSQAMLPPVEAHQTAYNVETIGIPTMMSGMARGLLGRVHALQFRHCRREAIRQADLIILAGAVCDFRLNYGRSLNRSAKIVIINRDKTKLNMNTDFWAPYLSIQADVGSTLGKVADELVATYSPCPRGERRCPDEWYQQLLGLEASRAEDIKKSCLADSPDGGLNPLKVLWMVEHHGLPLDSNIDGDSILVADGGDFVGSAAYILSPRGPLSWLDPGPFGTLGVGGGFALGAKLCRPEATVWIIYGDGSAGYSLAEFDAQARHKAPAIALIGNDACWSQIERDQVKSFDSSVACQLSPLAYERIGAAFSGHKQASSGGDCSAAGDEAGSESGLWQSRGGFLMDARTSDPVALLDKAKSLNQRGVPVVVNCIIGKSDFRKGSSSV